MVNASPRQVSRAFPLLAGQRNAAVDTALLEALPLAEAQVKPAILDLLLSRGREKALATLIASFEKYDLTLQALMIDRVAKLHGGVRLAMGNESLDVRRSAVELIRRSGDCRLGYLLAEALRENCPKTRETAARALQDMTANHLQSMQQADRSRETALQWETDGQHLADAIRRGMECWALHFRIEVLTAALWMAGRLEDALFQLASATRTNIDRPVAECLANTSDARLAGFAIRALAHEKLAPIAARAIESSGHASFVNGLIEQSWLLGDPKLHRMFHRIRQIEWFERGACDLAAMPASHIPGLARLVASSGLACDRKAAILADIFEACPPAGRGPALWQVIELDGPAANTILRLVASQTADPLARLARRELDRRQQHSGELLMAQPASPAASRTSTNATFADYWARFDCLTDAEQDDFRERLAGSGEAVLHDLRSKLSSADVRQRLRALRAVRHLGLTEALSEQLYHLANDPEPTVRSFTVVVLADLNNAVARRIVLRTLHDPDPRVQSNAIEALDRFSHVDSARQIETKMHAEHHRVRATAIAALLRMQAAPAGEALFDMLDSQSADERMSALWVIERLRLASLIHVLGRLAASDPVVKVRRRAERVLRSVRQEARAGELLAGQVR